MDGNNGEFHAETDAARAGSTPHIVRWILAISLFSAIALLSAIWITGALTQGDIEKEASISARIAERENGDTSSVAGDAATEIEAPQAADTAPSGPPTVEN
jgi:hypothetical protein